MKRVFLIASALAILLLTTSCGIDYGMIKLDDKTMQNMSASVLEPVKELVQQYSEGTISAGNYANLGDNVKAPVVETQEDYELIQSNEKGIDFYVMIPFGEYKEYNLNLALKHEKDNGWQLIYSEVLPGKGYIYDQDRGVLSFPQIAMEIPVPSQEFMQNTVIELEAYKVTNSGDDSAFTVASQIVFDYNLNGDRYRMFSLLQWDAAEWDQPRDASLMPTEVLRDSGGKWVLLHALSQDASQMPSDNDGAIAIQDFIDKYEQQIVKSAKFV